MTALLFVTTFQIFLREFSLLGIVNYFRQRNAGHHLRPKDSSKVGHRFRDEAAARDHELRTAMLGEQGVDQLLSALGKETDQDSMECRQDLARQFVTEVLVGNLITETLFSEKERTKIQAALKEEKETFPKPRAKTGRSLWCNAKKEQFG